jgi:hypothetical protein
MVTVRWHDKEFERKVLDPRIVRLLNRIGARGEAISKSLISGEIMPELKAVDKGFLMNSLSWIIDARKQIVRVGTYIARSDGKSLKYAIYVFLGLGTHRKRGPRPVLRTMLQMLLVEMRSWR